jgi:hypothetical protein
MKAYVMTTGTVFGLIVAAHIWRLIDEAPPWSRTLRTSSQLLPQPRYVSGRVASLWVGRARERWSL